MHAQSDSASPVVTSPPAAFSPLVTWLCFGMGNLLPSLGLLLILRGTPMPPLWQSGALHDYVTFLLAADTAALFYPFFFYAIACFTLGLFRPDVAVRRSIVRFGIYTGIPLAVQYWFIVAIVAFRIQDVATWSGFLVMALGIPLAGVLVAGGGWLACVLVRKVKRFLERRGGQRLWIGLLMLAAPCLALTVGLLPGRGSGGDWLMYAIILPGLLVVVATPVWMAAAYGALAWRIIRMRGKRRQLRLAELLGLFSWLAAYMAAWRFAIVQTLEAYAALPTEPPGTCYIATAATHGHAWLVRSWTVAPTAGAARRANMQLAYLKCGELVLRTVSPRVHRRVRSLYDRLGPPLARRMRSPWSADLTYLALKPAEWLVRVVIACWVPEAAHVAQRLYR